MLRQAAISDIPGMHRVRLAVRENRLTSSVIGEADYLPAISSTGRGWVVESQGRVLGFAVGNAQTGNIWALFVDPQYEGQGHGKALHAAMLDWLWSQGLQKLWLTTGANTRAARFYERAGWQLAGELVGGELRYEITRPT